MSDADRAVGTLIWMGRILILLAVVLYFPNYDWTKWLGAALLLVFPAFVALYWAGIRVRRTEVVAMTAVSVALAVTHIIIAVT